MTAPRTVLLVEDNAQNRYLATFLLEAGGFQVVPACDGPCALALVRSFVPVLILLDIQLPGMDGHALAIALRQIAVLDAVPIVAVTSYAMVGDRERALAAGCNGYIEKPLDPDTFVSELERIAARGIAEATPP